MTSQTATSDRRKYLTEEELKRFFAVIKNVRDRALFTVAYWRGLRASEIGSIPIGHSYFQVTVTKWHSTSW
jgi:integrase